MLESASEANAASQKREREETNEERGKEREGKIKGRTIRGFEANSVLLTQMLQTVVLTHRNVKAYAFFTRVISTRRAHAMSIPERVKRIRYYPPACILNEDELISQPSLETRERQIRIVESPR